MEMKRKKSLALLAGVVLVVSAVLFFLSHRGRHEAEDSSMKTFIVKKGEIHESIEATGEIKPCTGAEISLGARVTGTVIREPIEIGDKVKKGDLIAVIDNRALKETVEGARAALDKVKATYDNSIRKQKFELERQKLLKLNARQEVEAATRELAFAQWDFNSQKALFSRSTHSTSEKAFRQAGAVLARSRARFRQAENSLEAAELSVKEAAAELKRLKEEYSQALKIAEADLNKAKIRFSYSILRAPFSGIISYVSTQEGETVVAGLNAPQFAKILDDTRIENRVYVDETEIGKIRVGLKVQFNVDAWVNHRYKGVVTEIYPSPVLQNNVVYYIAVVTGFDNRPALKVRMTTHNEIYTKTLENVLIVPNSAVKFQDGRYVVSARINGRTRLVPVDAGAGDSHFTEIKSGIKEGMEILYRK